MPQPPRDMVMSAGAGTVLLVAAGVVMVAAVAYGILRLIRYRDPLMLYLLVGGAIACLLEPAVDVLGLIYMPEKGVATLFTLCDRGMPLFNIVSYTAVMGTMAYVAYRYFTGGITPNRALRVWVVIAVINTVNETPAVMANVYTYYGNQPLNPLGFPLWIAFVDPLFAIIAGALLVKLRQPLEQRRCLWASALLVPMAFGGGLGLAAWPMWLALNSDLPSFVPTIAAFVTLGLALFIVWIVGTVLADIAPSAVAAEDPATLGSAP